ncbi:MAG: hypothetical protein SFV55_09300 [Haliscomenobacter sp.]|uniref:hypothetical protein n=1 Tax=Haliscomenobacter sp. TaxID=2717303 RepID=UPI0029BDA263|nr:hypothetical protein [Haliscomenobacter sp.]MDX2068609.1 hypothetical protein [Haliscomenobacter sp.]
MKLLPRFALFFATSILGMSSFPLTAQNQILGTWYSNGRAEIPCTITQQGNNLVFTIGTNRSEGYFSNATTVFATQWNAYATLTTGGQGLLWNNQIWTRSPFSGYPSIAGNWGLAAYPQELYPVEQDNTFFTLTYQGKKLPGYFTSANTITIPEWNNAIASVAPDGNSITWNKQVWIKKSGPTTLPVNTPPVTQKLCRAELSSFYFAAQALGTVWGRMATEPPMLTPDAVTACTEALNTLDATLGIIQCIGFDRGRILKLRGSLANTGTRQLALETENLVRDLQAVVQNLQVNADNNVHIGALYIGGVHLGAAQAWASSRQCLPSPIPAAVQNVIQNHLATARNALAAYSACMPQFDLAGFGRVNLGSMNSILPHTQIVGIETQLLWAIALSDCCTTCTGTGTGSVGSGSDCDAECERYCKSIGKQYGRFNGRTICLSGVVSGGNSSGCDCW